MLAKIGQSPLLIPHSTTALPAVERFAVPNIVRIGNTIGEFQVADVSLDFEKYFSVLLEEHLPAVNIRSFTPTGCFRNFQAFNTLVNAGTHIARMVQVIELGRNGPGLFDEFRNIHFIHSEDEGQLRVVSWKLIDGGLYFRTESLLDTESEFVSDSDRVFSY